MWWQHEPNSVGRWVPQPHWLANPEKSRRARGGDDDSSSSTLVDSSVGFTKVLLRVVVLRIR